MSINLENNKNKKKRLKNYIKIIIHHIFISKKNHLYFLIENFILIQYFSGII